MEIAVAVKPVPDQEARLRPSADGRRLDPEGIKWVLAGYDESAVEQALLLKEAIPGSSIRALTFGPAPRSEEVLRSCLALGCDRATWVEHPDDGSDDPVLSARAVALALRKAPFEIVLCGKQAGDDELGLFGPALGAALEVPSYSAVIDLRVDGSAGSLNFRRSIERGEESVSCRPPVVLALQQAWNDPRTAKLPNILKSRKAPIERLPWTETAGALGDGATSAIVHERFELPAPRTGARLIEYKTPEEAAEKLVRVLREEAKVFP